jgi:hypothetical protein
MAQSGFSPLRWNGICSACLAQSVYAWFMGWHENGTALEKFKNSFGFRFLLLTCN